MCFVLKYLRNWHSLEGGRGAMPSQSPLPHLLAASCHVVELHHLSPELLEAVRQVLLIGSALHRLQGFFHLPNTQRYNQWQCSLSLKPCVCMGPLRFGDPPASHKQSLQWVGRGLK